MASKYHINRYLEIKYKIEFGHQDKERPELLSQLSKEEHPQK